MISDLFYETMSPAKWELLRTEFETGAFVARLMAMKEEMMKTDAAVPNLSALVLSTSVKGAHFSVAVSSEAGTPLARLTFLEYDVVDSDTDTDAESDSETASGESDESENDDLYTLELGGIPTRACWVIVDEFQALVNATLEDFAEMT